MDKPTSFSQSTMFNKCQLCWYYKYIKKIPVVDDMCYADAGSVMHKVVEHYINNRNREELKEMFNNLWLKYKLDKSKIRLKKDEYWLMILNAVNLDLSFTSTELKIFYPDVVGYIDAVNTDTDEIVDWKSSTRRPENESEYTHQLKFYSYLYKRKFGRLPKKATVYYLKYDGTKGSLSFTPTEDDIKEMEEWHLNTRKKMDAIVNKIEKPIKADECFMFCPYENLCGSSDAGLNYTLHLLGNTIQIDGPLSELLHKGMEKKFSYELKNAYFMKKNNPHARTMVKFWNPTKRLLPLGFLKGLKKTLNDYGDYKGIPVDINIVEHRNFNEEKIDMPDMFVNGRVLRDYQKEAVEEFLQEKIGILQIGTGGGKTEIAIEIIRRLGVQTLFVVDKIELLRQTKKRIEEALGIEVGQIGSGVKEIKPITVATVQTLIKNIGEYSKYLGNVRLCIFDETHKVAAKSYLRISQHLINSEYRLGISGTAFRDDGNDMMINAVTGYKCFDLSSKRLIDEGWLVRPTIVFLKEYMDKNEIDDLTNKCKTGLINETENYADFYSQFIVKNENRNKLIYDVTEKHKGKKTLIIVKLIEHGNILEELIPDSKYLHGSTNKTEREKMFEDFTKGELNVLISTISIFAEGIDIPALDMVINAAANKGDVKTIQVLGRILRKMEGKEGALYIDFLDESNFFRGASLARRKALVTEGHNIQLMKFEDYLK